MKVAVVGATGLVGRKMIEVLAERSFPLDTLIPVASERSAGLEITVKLPSIPGTADYTLKVITLQEALELKPDIALFSAGASISSEWAPRFAAAGCRVIDNSSYWRMDPSIKLIVPEVNGGELTSSDMIIANPNCSTIQMVVALARLHEKLRIKRIVVSTYQSVTGSGQKGISQLERERLSAFNKANSLRSNSISEAVSGEEISPAYPHPIDKNLIPHIDSFTENGYTKEEMKMVNETRKIFGDHSIAVTATTVRVPVEGGHSESVNVTFDKGFEMEQIFEILRDTPGVVLQDDPRHNLYPMPLFAFGRDEVFVGRVRRDFSAENSINLWIVADNLRRGAATNAVMVAEAILRRNSC